MKKISKSKAFEMVEVELRLPAKEVKFLKRLSKKSKLPVDIIIQAFLVTSLIKDAMRTL